MTAESFDQDFNQAGYQPEIALSVADIFSSINPVSGGLVDSLLSGRVVEFSPRMTLLGLAPAYASFPRLALLFPGNRERDPILLALAAECRMFKQGVV